METRKRIFLKVETIAAKHREAGLL